MKQNSAIRMKRRERQKEDKYLQGYRKDDLEDRNRFIEKHLPLVISIARKRLNQGLEFEDLVQEGILGLVTAAEKFDPDKGFRFSTYATWWIRQAIDDAVLKHGDTIKKPSNYASHLKNLLHTSNKLEQELGRDPSVQELSAGASLDRNMARQLLSLIPGTVSLDAPIAELQDQSNNYLDVIEDRETASPADSSIKRHMKEDVKRVLGLLSEKERKVIDLRFGLSGGETRSLREVGRVFNLSPERIRQIEEQALQKLRRTGKVNSLREYLN